MKQRWVFTDVELKQPENCNAYDEFVARCPLNGIEEFPMWADRGIVVQRCGEVTLRYADGTKGPDQEEREMAGDVESLSTTDGVLAENWRDVLTNEQGEFLGFAGERMNDPTTSDVPHLVLTLATEDKRVIAAGPTIKEPMCSPSRIVILNWETKFSVHNEIFPEEGSSYISDGDYFKVDNFHGAFERFLERMQGQFQFSIHMKPQPATTA